MLTIDTEFLIKTHADLIRINSIGPGLEGCIDAERPVQKYLLALFKELNIPTCEHQVLDGRNNIIAQLEGESGRTLLLESHMDVVSTKGMTIEPFDPVEKDGRIYGRGACDTKGSMACMLAVIAAFAKAHQRPPVNLAFIGMVGEETGFEGAKKFVEDKPLVADAAIIGEPTLCHAVTAHKGGIRYSISTKGKAAHGSKPHLGVNAIHAMAKIISILEQKAIPHLAQRIHPLCGCSTLNIGGITGGTQINFVPDVCNINIDQRLIPGEDAQTSLNEIEAILAENTNQLDIDFNIHSVRNYDAVETPQDSAFAQACFAATNQKQGHGEPYGTDASFIQQAGIPCIVLGPGSIDQAHAAVEYIERNELIKCAEIYKNIVMAFGS